MVSGLGGRNLACDDAQRTGQIDGDKDVESVLARIELADQVCEKILVLLRVTKLVAQEEVDVGNALAKDRGIEHICWDGCMFPNDVMMQPKTWNDVLGAMIQVREKHGWVEAP